MWRTGLLLTVMAAGAWLLVQLLVTTDREQVEQNLERLLEAAREGGPAAADEILDAFADDYRGEGVFSRASIERHLARTVAPGRVERLTSGDFKTAWSGEEIVVPILSLSGRAGGREVRLVLHLTYARRGERWQIVDVSRFQWR